MGLFTKAVTTIARGLGFRDQRLVQYFGGGETDSGEVITVDGSLQLDVVWACVRLISQTIATLPLHTYRTDQDGHGVVAKDHALYRLLHDRPNYEMTAVEFWEAAVAAVLLWGNAYIAITRMGARITALYPMRPDRIVLRREADGSLSYTYTWGGQVQTFAETDVLHIKGFSLDGYMGISPVAVARNSMGAARAAERASSSIHKNGMRPSGVLTAPEYLTDTQREDAKAILAGFKGATNTGSTPLLEGGWTWQSLAIPPEDAQLLQTRSFQVEQLCRWFDVPPIMVGHGISAYGGSGTEQLMLHFYTSCLRSHLKRIEQAIKKSLISASDEAAGLYVEFNIEGLLRADSAARAALYSTYVQNGIINRDEARSKENLAPIPGGGGQEFTVQANLIPIDQLERLVARQATSSPAQAPAAVMDSSGAPAARIPEIRQ